MRSLALHSGGGDFWSLQLALKGITFPEIVTFSYPSSLSPEIGGVGKPIHHLLNMGWTGGVTL
jgi:hypothetical protein